MFLVLGARHELNAIADVDRAWRDRHVNRGDTLGNDLESDRRLHVFDAGGNHHQSRRESRHDSVRLVDEGDSGRIRLPANRNSRHRVARPIACRRA